MKLYLKIFFLMGIPYGVIMGICLGFPAGISKSLWDAVKIGLIISVFCGVSFGGIMSLFIGIVQEISMKRTRREEDENPERVHQVRTLELKLPFDKAFELCVNSVSQIKQGKIVKENKRHGKIDAKTGMSWEAFGEDISFSLIKLNDDITEIEVSSKPKHSRTLVDFCKNLKNIHIIEDYLRRKEKSHLRKLKKTSE